MDPWPPPHPPSVKEWVIRAEDFERLLYDAYKCPQYKSTCQLSGFVHLPMFVFLLIFWCCCWYLLHFEPLELCNISIELEFPSCLLSEVGNLQLVATHPFLLGTCYHNLSTCNDIKLERALLLSYVNIAWEKVSPEKRMICQSERALAIWWESVCFLPV